MRRRVFLDRLARASTLAPFATWIWADTNEPVTPRPVSGFEFARTTDWLARWQRYILGTAKERRCDTDLGESVAWFTAPYLNGFYYGYRATRDVSWVYHLVDYADSWLKRGVKEPDGFIGWPTQGTGSELEQRFVTDSLLGEAVGLRPIVLMAKEIQQNEVLTAKLGSKAKGWLDLAEQVFEKWMARGCWREVKAGGLWVVPAFGIDRQTGKWTEGYERRNETGFSNPQNKENYIALWLLAMWDVLQKPVYKDHAEKWFRLLKSRLRTREDGKFYVWNYWDPAGPWDYLPNNDTVHWVGVHPSGGYYQMDAEGMVSAFEHGLVFTKEDIHKLIATNRDFMWNQELLGAKFQRIDGRLTDGQKTWGGCLWPALVPYDEALRKVFVANHDPGSFASVDLTPWFRARLAAGLPPQL
jgi:hypothetical protein